MSTIKIHELKPSGIELFEDSESYLNQLNEDEIAQVVGGVFALNLEININLNINVSNTASVNTIGNTVVGVSINANSNGNFNSIQVISAF